ncbi:trna (guanine-n -)-methyltransferase [Ophiostoma piceae UAMH 11346]|uniref:tRNA (guanine(37)-N1)-methyltransferase n=1 Tax=Ophiostoma piceae (strain UAMH 11346) TaxID=1262450 RepID=S3CS18_OPHP1|nr:trna (guanine-n -)-methyltransferase [Ophiostoma piceae UAMH 11346]
MGAGQKRSRPESSSDDKVSASGLESGSGAPSTSAMSFIRPPILRSAALTASATLNKALFTETFEIAAARVHDNRLISKFQKALTGTQELLKAERIAPVADDPETISTETPGQAKSPQRRKCLLLNPTVSPTAPDSWSDVLKQAVEKKELGVIPYKLTLDYDYWTSRDVLVSVLPEEFHDDIPTGFNTAGHVAHLNLRDRFQPYKYIVAQVLLDKNANLRTVINKVDLVGTESVFRTFPYEVLAGPDDMDVEVRENMCTFRFDYSKVYWNSKLEPEHSRLLYMFKPGEVVVDLMSGIGPFAVPAGKRGVFVWANDMNPNSYEAMQDAIHRNKVGAYVRPFNEDGLVFIHKSADLVREASAAGNSALEVSETTAPNKPPPLKQQKQQQKLTSAAAPAAPAAAAATSTKEPKAKGNLTKKPAAERKRVHVPPTISHFVMNLPASATTFLPHFKGLYAGHEDLFKPTSDSDSEEKPRLPIVHVHCFAPKLDDQSIPKGEVCERVSGELGVQMTLCETYAEIEQDDPVAEEPKNLVYVHNVRAVAPHKSMFCASFRIPAAVAFAPREEQTEQKAE